MFPFKSDDATKGVVCHHYNMKGAIILCGKQGDLYLTGHILCGLSCNYCATYWPPDITLLCRITHPNTTYIKAKIVHNSISVQVMLMDSWLCLALPHVQGMHSHSIVLSCAWVAWMQSSSGEWMTLQICVPYHRYQPILMIAGQMMPSQVVLGE